MNMQDMYIITLNHSDDKVELLDPPSDSKPGEFVFVEGYERETVGGMCAQFLT